MAKAAGPGKESILIIENDKKVLGQLKKMLEGNYSISSVGSFGLAREELRKKFYNLAITELKLPDGSGLDLLKKIKGISAETLVIVLTAHSTVDSVIQALNEGAFAFFKKPVKAKDLKGAMHKGLSEQKLFLENKSVLHKLKELSLKDPHTELYNFRYLMERLESELKRAKRYALPISIVMLDLDYFKSINDVYGHQYGDLILTEFARFLKESVRGNDIVIRYGGEEFVIILPDTNEDCAAMFGNRLRDSLKKYIFDPKGNKINLKASLGVASYPGDASEVDTLIGSADKALLSAKDAGRGRLMTYKNTKKAAGKEEKADRGENVDSLRRKLSKIISRIDHTLLESVYAFAKTIKTKDSYPVEHAEEMVSLVTDVAKKIKLHDKDVDNLRHAAVLHDLGKVGIPDDILQKESTLSQEEREIIKKHPKIGAEIIRPIHFLKELVPIILYHHERFDGFGYSAGLKGEEIPIGARIVAIADVYQALVANRPYRKAYTKQEALDIIKAGAGTQFDPKLVDAFIAVINQEENKAR
ncbi:diguanylate cyclase [Candidatus Omnitrophota bacterium]